MHKRGIYLITAIVVSLALLFQLIRTDVFLDWQHVLNTAIRGEQERQGEPAEDLAPDHFVIIYDPENVASVFARHHLEEMLTRQKKTSESIHFDETVDEIPAGTCGVLIAMGDLGSLVSVPAIEQYVEDGGTAAVLIHPDAGREPLPEGFLRQLGITSTGGCFPELKVYASLFDGLYKDKCYYQDFKRNAVGTYGLPRLSSGYSPKGLELWQDICGANYFGIFSHFIHPDEIFFKETGDKGWKELSAGFDRYLREIYTRYSWLHAETASECADALGDIIDMDYRTEQLADGLRIVSWGWQQPLHFILRTPHTVEWTQGCTVTQLDGDAWLIEVTDADARLYWAKE